MGIKWDALGEVFVVGVGVTVVVVVLFSLGAWAFHDMYQSPWVNVQISHLVRTFHT